MEKQRETVNILAGLFAMLLGLACLALAHAAAERHDIKKRQTPVEIGPQPLDYVPRTIPKKQVGDVSTMFAKDQ